jgi:cell division initiation protein
MLRTEQILNATFTPVSKGTYSAEEVDAFLRTVAASYEESLGENRELIKKISILADKIESYRNDEEAIKLALLDAHKMAESISKSASDKAEALVADAENKSKILLDGANRQTAQMIEEAREQAKAEEMGVTIEVYKEWKKRQDKIRKYEREVAKLMEEVEWRQRYIEKLKAQG